MPVEPDEILPPAQQRVDEFLRNADRNNHDANDQLVESTDRGRRHDIHGRPS